MSLSDIRSPNNKNVLPWNLNNDNYMPNRGPNTFVLQHTNQGLVMNSLIANQCVHNQTVSISKALLRWIKFEHKYYANSEYIGISRIEMKYNYDASNIGLRTYLPKQLCIMVTRDQWLSENIETTNILAIQMY